MTIEISLGLWQDRPAAEALETARLAGSLGFPALWIGEMATYDAFALATAVGPLVPPSTRLVLGPFAVTVRDPMMIAMGAASVAALTGRAVSVALGTSSTVVVEQWHGRSRARAARALEESARAVRVLLDGGKAEEPGEVVRTSGYRLRLPAPGPFAAPAAPSPDSAGPSPAGAALSASGAGSSPAGAALSAGGAGSSPAGAALSAGGAGAGAELVVAAFGERAVATAGRHADRMVLNLVDPPTAGELVERLRAQAPGRRVAVWTPTAIGTGLAASYEQLRRGIVGYLAAPGYADMFQRAGFGDVVAFARTRPHPKELLAAVPDELVAAIGVVGDADAAAKRVAEYHAHGVDDVVLVPAANEGDPAGAATLAAAAGLA